MNLMHAVERETLAGKKPVEGGKPEGKEPVLAGLERRRRQQLAQIFEARRGRAAPFEGRMASR